jgi:hypothetical protein
MSVDSTGSAADLWTWQSSPSPRGLDRIYRLPNPMQTLEQWECLHHRDIAGRGTGDLERELRRVRLRLALDPRPSPWLEERDARLLGELRRRRP